MALNVILHGELFRLLPQKKRTPCISVAWSGKRSIKDLVQSLQIPITETGRILVNHHTVSNTHILSDNDSIDVYPYQSPDPPATPPQFICDVHLWKLARRLRMLGFSTLFNPEWDDAQLAEIASKKHLTLLTRDKGLLKRKIIIHGLLVRHTDPEKQTKEILDRLNIQQFISPFTRCIMCNHYLLPCDTNGKYFKEILQPHIPAGVLKWSIEFTYCPNCRKPFWKGSHYERLMHKIQWYSKI